MGWAGLEFHTSVDGHGCPPSVVVTDGQSNNQAMLAKVLSGIVVRRHRSHMSRRQRPGPPLTLGEIRHKQN